MPKYHACWWTQRPRLGRPCNEQAPPHPFFDFLKQLEHARSSLPLYFPRVHMNLNSHLTLLSFLLRKELGSSLESFLKPTVNTSKGKESSIQFLLHTLSKKLRNSKTLLSSLPLIFSGPATRKGRSFHARAIYFYFPSRTINLVRVLVTLILESMISSRNF